MAWMPWSLLLAAALFAGYLILVKGPNQARMEKLAGRMDALIEIEESMRDYRDARAGLQTLPNIPLPELRKTLETALPGMSVRLEEVPSRVVHESWKQRRTRVVFENCPLFALHTWLLSVQAPGPGWRLVSLNLRAESSEGYGSGELELAGMERTEGGTTQ